MANPRVAGADERHPLPGGGPRSASVPGPVSAPIGERTTVWWAARSSPARSTYGPYPMTTSAWRTAAAAAGVRSAGAPGPSPTTARCPSGPARRATATVASPDRRFSTTRPTRARPPAAARAAASATEGVPTAASTTSLGFGTGIAARTSAGKVRSGTPSAAANSTMAGSAAFRSTVATHPTASTESPAAANVSMASRCSASGSAPLLDPTPRTSDLGRRTTSPAPGSTSRSVTTTWCLPPPTSGSRRAGDRGRRSGLRAAASRPGLGRWRQPAASRRARPGSRRRCRPWR